MNLSNNKQISKKNNENNNKKMSRNNNRSSIQKIRVRLEEAKRAKQQYEEQLSQINGYVEYLQKTIPLLKDVEITDTRQESRTTTTTSTMAQRAPTASVDRMVDDDDYDEDELHIVEDSDDEEFTNKTVAQKPIVIIRRI